jgi:signal transduction histidine kinase
MRAIEIINRTSSLYKKGVSQREVVNINEVINEITPLLRNEAGRWEISIRTDLAPDVPSISGDRIQLQQVLMNLAINAIDAMKEVNGTRTLTLSSKRDNGALTVSVVDTGVGLPSNTNHIFEAFYTTKSHGTGMGLAISRTIVESHGGRLSAISNQGGGATFCFTIPAATGVHA